MLVSFRTRLRCSAVLFVTVVVGAALSTTDAHAIRPFITDDARTVGQGRLQIETYWRRDRESLQHWMLPAVGPTPWFELTLGGVHGLAPLGQRPDRPRYALGGPIAQGKFLLHDAVPNDLPGVGVVVGGQPPAGRGGFEAPGWSGFTYLAVTQAFFKEDDFLIHGNVGLSAISAPGIDPAKVTWGIGTQVETLFDFHLIGEIFSGDPYAVGAGGAYQTGFRQIFNDHIQLDFTFGGGLWGDILPVWFSSGVRIVSHELW
ncbi:MAG: hypothetical protein KIS78_01600 [Labilithrix sp.]|nr:hypothetical protein [Labilithrix sp.]